MSNLQTHYFGKWTLECHLIRQVHQLLGELLSGDPDGGRYTRLLHQLLYGQEQERPRRLSMVRRTQGMDSSLKFIGLDLGFLQIYLRFGNNMKLIWYQNCLTYFVNYDYEQELLEANFALVGDDGAKDLDDVETQLVKESEHGFVLWCSGRVGCESMLVSWQQKNHGQVQKLKKKLPSQSLINCNN